MGADHRFAERWVEAFVYAEAGTVELVGSPDIRWLDALELPHDVLLEARKAALEAYWKCFAITMMEPAAHQTLYTELIDAQTVVAEMFLEGPLTDEQLRRLAVNLWRGARARGVPVRVVDPSDG